MSTACQKAVLGSALRAILEFYSQIFLFSFMRNVKLYTRMSSETNINGSTLFNNQLDSRKAVDHWDFSTKRL